MASRTLSVSIARRAADVYEFVFDRANFAKWAAGAGDPSKVRFVERNSLGVLDHYVDTPQGEVYVPMRVIANGQQCEFVFTLLRVPAMTDEMFEADAHAVERDLATL